MANILFYCPSAGRKVWFVDDNDELPAVIDPDLDYKNPDFFKDPTEFMRRLANITEEELDKYFDRLYVFYREMELDEYEANNEVEKDEKRIRKKLNKLRELFQRYPDLRVIYYSDGSREYWFGPGLEKMFKFRGG